MVLLDEAIRLSERMLELIESGAWQQLAGLDEQRQPLIRAYFRQPHVDADAVIRLKTLNDRIVGQLSRQRQQVRDRQLRMQQGQQAARQYLDNR